MMRAPPPDETMAMPVGLVPLHWRRSPQARRISLRIDSSRGALVITLPPRGSRNAGLALLRDHMDWANARLAALPQPVELRDGALIPISGVNHLVRHTPDGKGGAWIEAGEIRVAGDVDFLSRRVTDLLRSEARRHLGPLAHGKAEQVGLNAKRITCKDTRSRWGSCTVDGVLMFSWRLLMAPPFVQDYVTAHEVAHLRHMNHGASFWHLVRSLTPHTEDATQWLRQDGPGLLRIG